MAVINDCLDASIGRGPSFHVGVGFRWVKVETKEFSSKAISPCRLDPTPVATLREKGEGTSSTFRAIEHRNKCT